MLTDKPVDVEANLDRLILKANLEGLTLKNDELATMNDEQQNIRLFIIRHSEFLVSVQSSCEGEGTADSPCLRSADQRRSAKQRQRKSAVPSTAQGRLREMERFTWFLVRLNPV
jgi:hypothetical protein